MTFEIPPGERAAARAVGGIVGLAFVAAISFAAPILRWLGATIFG